MNCSVEAGQSCTGWSPLASWKWERVFSLRRALPGFLRFACVALAIPWAAGQSHPTTAALTVAPGDPYTLACTVTGPQFPNFSGPSGTVTITDLTAGQAVGTATLGTTSVNLYTSEISDVGNFGMGAAVATGDFNGDGKADFVSVNTGAITVFLGNGDGTFGTPVDTELSNVAIVGSLVTGDFNGDGYTDVALSVPYSSINPVTAGDTVLVFLGNGDGTFGAPQTYTAGSEPEQMVVANFGNGHLDLAVANYGANSVTVLLGDGTGAFPTQNTYAVGNEPSGIAAVDLRENGDLDLAVTSAADAAVSVLRGNGDGTFQPQQDYPTGENGGQFIVAGDFNNDGAPDVAFLAGTNLEVMLNDGSGGLMTPIATPLPTTEKFDGTGSGILSIADFMVGDFNGDGNLDIAAGAVLDLYGADSTAGAFQIAYGDGTGSFGSFAVEPAPYGGSISGIVTADFNGDGVPDLAGEPVEDAEANLIVLLNRRASATGTLSDVLLQVGTSATHNLQCAYNGDTNYAASTSAPVAVTIPPAMPPTLSLVAGDYAVPEAVTITDATPGAAIYYTTDGNPPSSSSTLYTAPVALAGAETLQAVAYAPGFLPSSVTSASYTLQAATPVLSLPAGVYTAGTTVTISDGPTFGSIYYTTDGTPPSTHSTLYTGPITLSSSETIQAIAAAPSLLNSAVASAAYTVAAATPTPVITPASGGYPTNPSITISDSGSGATIYYTTNGSTPTTASTVYSGAFTVTPSVVSTVTVKAIAIASGNATSAMATATFTVTSTNSVLTVAGSDPYTLTCAVSGPAVTGIPGPSGMVTFTDTTTSSTLGTATLGGSTTAQTFPQMSLGAGFSPFVVADVNGDGIPDLVAPSQSYLNVYLGNGDGTFRTAPQVKLAPVSARMESQTLTAVDFNGDGKLDLAFENAADNEVLVLLGNGDGTFQTPPVVHALPGAANIVAGNFNGDPYGDLAVTVPGMDEVAIFLGNSAGTLQDPSIFPAGPGPRFAVSANFTGGTRTDLAILNPHGVSVLPGNGDGTFGTPIFQVLSFTPMFAASGDFNHDGKSDLAVSDGSSVWVLLGNGDGTFQNPAASAFDIVDASALASADLNGDGIPDLAVVGVANVFVSLGNGNGTFGTPAVTGITPWVTDNPTLAAADLNGDGRVDLVTSGRYSVMAGFNYEQATATAALANVTVTAGTIASHALQCSYPGDSNYAASNSNLVTQNYGHAATPVFSLLVGNYSTAQTVSISDATPNTTIYYTNDGSTPTTSSTVYTGPISVSSTVTLKAIAAGVAVTPSAVSEVVYTITDPPTSSVAAGVVTLADDTAGATIYYTTDGSAPSKTSTKYTAPFSIYGKVTVNAIALAPQHLFSAVASATYTSGLATSSTALTASTLTGDENQKITLTATVNGFNPTGTVTFLANGQSVGSAALSGGTATTQVSFASAGTYSVTGAYGGDGSNTTSTSSSVSIVIAAPSFTVGSDPTTQTISPGQTASFTITVTPAGGYDGTVKFSCGSLPSKATCTFVPASVTPANGAAVTTKLQIATTAATNSRNHPPEGSWSPWRTGGLALAGLLGLTLTPKKMRGLRAVLGALLLASLWLPLAGCGGGSSGGGNKNGNPGTPAGSYTISVTAADSSAGTNQTVSISLTVN